MTEIRAGPPALPESPYAQQLQQGFGRLLFEQPALEAEFREEFTAAHLRRTRLGFGVALALYAAYAVLRLQVESGAGAAAGLQLRSVVVGALALTLVWTWIRPLRAWLPHLTLGTYGVVAGSIGGVEVVSQRHGFDFHYEGLILASFHLYAFGGLLLRRALIGGGLIVGVYAVIGLAAGLASLGWAYQLFFVLLTQAIGVAALYSAEHVERDSFLRRRMFAVMATHDALTGLYNRLAFFQQFAGRAAQAARDGRAIGLMVLDVDHFKAFNDRYGHLEGDACLRAVAAALRPEFRRPTDMVARYGGEEFVGLWYDIQPQSLRSLAEQLRGAVQALKIPHEGAPSGRVTASVGAVACVPRENEALPELIERADRLLYEAKSRGRNRVAVETLARVAPAAAGRRTPTL